MKRLANLIITDVENSINFFNAANTPNVVSVTNRRCWGIFLKYEGETIYRSNNHKYLSNAGCMTIIPKGCNYSWECVKPGRCVCIGFQSDFVEKDIISVNIQNSDRILKMFNVVAYKLLTYKPFQKMEVIRDVYSILLEMAEQSQKISPHSLKVQKLEPAVKHILMNYNRTITNDELAQLTGLSTVYFRKLFTEVYGISPIAYAKEMRMKVACQMLRSDHSGLSEVALSLGYSNLYDFSRDFKRHMSISPSKYVKDQNQK